MKSKAIELHKIIPKLTFKVLVPFFHQLEILRYFLNNPLLYSIMFWQYDGLRDNLHIILKIFEVLTSFLFRNKFGCSEFN